MYHNYVHNIWKKSSLCLSFSERKRKKLIYLKYLIFRIFQNNLYLYLAIYSTLCRRNTMIQLSKTACNLQLSNLEHIHYGLFFEKHSDVKSWFHLIFETLYSVNIILKSQNVPGDFNSNTQLLWILIKRTNLIIFQ